MATSLEGDVIRMSFARVVIVGLFVSSACGPSGPSEAELAAAAAREAELAAASKAKAEREVRLEAQRLAALWSYQEAVVNGGRQVTAAIRSTNDVETDGQSARAVQLVFRDHAAWGRSSYLVLQAGDFDCSPRCTVGVTADDGTPLRMASRRPDTDEAIAMFINDSQTLWRLAAGATRLAIEFPVKAGGTRSASFDVAGLDEAEMPGWRAAPGD